MQSRSQAMLALLLLLCSADVYGLAIPNYFDLPVERSCVMACIVAGARGKCYECVDQFLPIAPLPSTYLVHLLSMQRNGFTQEMCKKREALHPEEGVDLSQHPSGWMLAPANATSKFTGCERTSDYPGMGATSYNSHEEVKELLGQLPSRQAAGDVWRGNERGTFIANSMFWDKVSPRSNLLGHTPKQHQVVRPVMEAAWSCNMSCADNLEASAAAFLHGRDRLSVQKDVRRWVFEELFKKAFPGDENPIDSEDFVETQAAFVDFQPLAQILPGVVSRLAARRVQKQTDRLFRSLRTHVEKHYGEELKEKDCSPSKSCLDQQTSAFLDIFLGAGGLSVPSAISTALYVIYGETDANVFPQGLKVDNKDPLPLYMESLRFFAPVEAVTYWQPAPLRAEDDEASQTEGGNRHLLMLALANKDPNAWGEDAHKFRVRDMAEYREKFLGFAEPAQDDSVAGGKMNRFCPGKALALKMGEVFFKHFEQDKWIVQGDKPSDYVDFSPFVQDFDLVRKTA